jgi:hypothetical protein
MPRIHQHRTRLACDEDVIAVKPAPLDEMDVWWQHIVLDL